MIAYSGSSPEKEQEVDWEAVLYEGPGPFSGATWGKLRVVRSALYGHLVRVESVNDYRGDGEYILTDIYLPGEWVFGTFLSQSGDIILTPVNKLRVREGMLPIRSAGFGSTRVMGMGAFKGLEVLEPRPWVICDQCSRWRPAEDTIAVWDDGPLDWGGTPRQERFCKTAAHDIWAGCP